LFSIPESIQKYQYAITNTNVRKNNDVDIGLHMIPLNLALQVGVIQKYNNNIVIADDSREIGENKNINPLDSAAAVNPVHQRTKFRKDRSNRCGHMAIFVIFKMAAAAILNFQKFKILTLVLL